MNWHSLRGTVWKQGTDLSSIPCGNSPGGGIPGGTPGGPPTGIRPRPLPRMLIAPGRPGNPAKQGQVWLKTAPCW